MHFDLSFNRFNYKESKLISQALITNYWTYGFHFEGNYGFMNTKGYLEINEED